MARNNSTVFVLFDNEAGLYTDYNQIDPKTSTWHLRKSYNDVQNYKRRYAAIEAASMMNVNRNVPAGFTSNHKYQNRPQVVVLEIDDQGNIVQTYQAPPRYIYL